MSTATRPSLPELAAYAHTAAIYQSSQSSQGSRSSSESFTSIPAVQSYPIPFGGGVDIVRDPTRSKSEDDIITVAVRVARKKCRLSDEDVDVLPERRPRSFLSRLSTRLRLSDSRSSETLVVRMPRAEYWRHHRRDAAGNYAGTEPEREWDEKTLQEAYAQHTTWSIGGVNGSVRARV